MSDDVTLNSVLRRSRRSRHRWPSSTTRPTRLHRRFRSRRGACRTRAFQRSPPAAPSRSWTRWSSAAPSATPRPGTSGRSARSTRCSASRPASAMQGIPVDLWANTGGMQVQTAMQQNPMIQKALDSTGSQRPHPPGPRAVPVRALRPRVPGLRAVSRVNRPTALSMPTTRSRTSVRQSSCRNSVP